MSVQAEPPGARRGTAARLLVIVLLVVCVLWWTAGTYLTLLLVATEMWGLADAGAQPQPGISPVVVIWLIGAVGWPLSAVWVFRRSRSR